MGPHGPPSMNSQKFPPSLSGSGGGAGPSKPQSSEHLSIDGSLPPMAIKLRSHDESMHEFVSFWWSFVTFCVILQRPLDPHSAYSRSSCSDVGPAFWSELCELVNVSAGFDAWFGSAHIGPIWVCNSVPLI